MKPGPTEEATEGPTATEGSTASAASAPLSVALSASITGSSKAKAGNDSHSYAAILLTATHAFGLPVAKETKGVAQDEEASRHTPLTTTENERTILTAAGALYANAMAKIVGVYIKNPNAPDDTTDIAMKAAIAAACDESQADDEFKERLIELTKSKDALPDKVTTTAKRIALGNFGDAKVYTAKPKEQKQPSTKGRQEEGKDAKVAPHWSEDGKSFTMVLRTTDDGRYFANEILEKNNYDITKKYDFNVPIYRRKNREEIGWDATLGVLEKAQESGCYNFTPTFNGQELTTEHLLDSVSPALKGMHNKHEAYITSREKISAKFGKNTGYPVAFNEYQKCAEKIYLSDVYKHVIALNLAKTAETDYTSGETFDPSDHVAVHRAIIQNINVPANARIARLEEAKARAGTTEEKKGLEEKITETRVLRDRAKKGLEKEIKTKPLMALELLGIKEASALVLNGGKLDSKYGPPSKKEMDRMLKPDSTAPTTTNRSITDYEKEIKAKALKKFKEEHPELDMKGGSKLAYIAERLDAAIKQEEAKDPILQQSKKLYAKFGIGSLTSSKEEKAAKASQITAAKAACKSRIDPEKFKTFIELDLKSTEAACAKKADIVTEVHMTQAKDMLGQAYKEEALAFKVAAIYRAYEQSKKDGTISQDQSGLVANIDDQVKALIEKEGQGLDRDQVCKRAEEIVASCRGETDSVFSTKSQAAYDNLTGFNDRFPETASDQSLDTIDRGRSDGQHRLTDLASPSTTETSTNSLGAPAVNQTKP